MKKHQEKLAKSISIHPRYSGTRRLYKDVAIIHLKEPFVIEKNVKPIPLPESAESYDGSDCIVTGWGDSGNVMKSTNISLVENNKCQDLLRATDTLTDTFELEISFICAGGEEGKDVCEGDGGGPLVCKKSNTENEYVFCLFFH